MRFIDEVQDEALEDPNREIPNVRLIYTKSGRKLRLERKDPYGFVYVVWDSGHPPSELQSAYTDFDQARVALENYIASETFEKISDVPTEKVAPLKYKKRFRDAETDENLPV